MKLGDNRRTRPSRIIFALDEARNFDGLFISILLLKFALTDGPVVVGDVDGRMFCTGADGWLFRIGVDIGWFILIGTDADVGLLIFTGTENGDSGLLIFIGIGVIGWPIFIGTEDGGLGWLCFIDGVLFIGIFNLDHFGFAAGDVAQLFLMDGVFNLEHFDFIISGFNGGGVGGRNKRELKPSTINCSRFSFRGIFIS